MQNQIAGRHAANKKLESNILQISQEAKAMKKKYDDVIDATVGMLHHEEGNVFKYQIVEDLLKGLTDAETYHYAPVRGTPAFSEGAFDWVFGKNAETIRKNFYHAVIPTTGGSGAISDTFYNFNDFGQKVLIPNHYWTPYQNFAYEANLGLQTFSMYDDMKRFNVAAFKEAALNLAHEQNRLSVLLNDPCNNPTGLCMTREDWDKVIEVLNQIASEGIPVTLMQDIAYVDYQMKPVEMSRDIFLSYLNLHPDILTVVIFSGSKTFSLYGFRVGAQIGLSKNKDVLDTFVNVGDYSVRARFSSVNQPGMSIIGKIFSNPENKQKFQDELVIGRKLLRDRAVLFMEEADKVGLDMLPYCGGFFISVLTDNKNIFQDLASDHVYVIHMDNLIRIAISSLPLTDIPRLVRILKKHV
ncbi:MAG TPA: aminotransferase class I/II-fold pyridoxal phosphate-dependent enzyme [Bacillota bacterium]|nr:aminotransferase class I/II-fold pyridoxal phosphate-dependent enzyme [Bacillota bacterium]HPF42100.1 aminotransferase class I/II-fold pyridoxal phosphate-dependent enzyme [Bacillota bacterium]HPJ85822.1 aminotransferase class I/II-fold pyridoxal phosphate-dependent enzyme [Bacillota bacterium]HPQ61547.1 aminotransferase class I/II-fold pyridoxal phosphate-dependent enzyme [Bacillota bacterium]HRX91359.1 aminotransferase class I/II-fold pyridoxal phosphate-dependent enzyme [Candidatus Izemop